MNNPATGTSSVSRWLLMGFLALALLADVGARVRLLDFPLERDEGEYAYLGQLILEGIPPYQLAGNMKMPGIYLAYATAMSVFGQTPAGIHLGLLVVHLTTLAFLFLIARMLLDIQGAAIATAAYALMTLSPAYLGLAAHATHFVMLFALGGTFLILRAGKNGGVLACFGGGCFYGTAFLMKQPGMFFGVFGGLYLVWVLLAGKTSGRQILVKTGLYSLGCALPFLAVCLWLKLAGVFPQFWFWTVTYAREYGTAVTLTDGAYNAKRGFASIFRASPWLWGVAGAGLFCLCMARLALNRKIFLGGFFVFSLLAVCPGLYFREHYFILLAPAVALLAGLAVSWGCQRLATENSTLWLYDLPFVLAAFACFQSLYADRAILFSLTPSQACRAIYGMNPFPESLDIAQFVEKNTTKDQRILVMGDEPQIYFYSHRLSSTSHIYPSQLMDPRPYAHNMQEDMIDEITRNPPQVLIMVIIPMSWVARPNSDRLLFNWATEYAKQNMKPVGLIQFDRRHTTETWGEASIDLHSKYFIMVYKRTAAK